MVVRSDFHAAKAAEEALSLIGASAFIRIGDSVIDAPSLPTCMERIPASSFVGMDDCQIADMIANHRHRVAFVANDEGQRLAATLTHNDNALALARLINGKATVAPIFLAVFGTNVTAEIGTVDFDNAVESPAFLFAGHRLAQLVRKDKGGLVLHVQIAAQLERGDTLGTVHEDHDSGQKVGEGQLPAGKDRAAGDAELVMTGNALELATGGNVVGLNAAATRANGLAFRLRPAEIAEGRMGFVFRHTENGLQAQSASGCGEEKVLCHVIVSSAYAPYMMALGALVNGKCIAYDDI